MSNNVYNLTRKLTLHIISTLLLSCSTATAGILFINFDDVPPGNDSGTRYLPLGVQFFVGNGTQGTSTAIREDSNGNLITGRISNFGTSVSSPNVLVPASASNDDLWVQFYNPTTYTRTLASFASIQNDAEGFPKSTWRRSIRQATLSPKPDCWDQVRSEQSAHLISG